MKTKFHINFRNLLITSMLFAVACGEKNSEPQQTGQHHSHEDEMLEVHLTPRQFDAMELKVGPLTSRTLSATVNANGRLEVPPQNEASVTSIVGGNIYAIQVIEGDDVKKGQTLAYLSHPSITELQSNYLDAFNELSFLEKEYQRKKKLYEEEVGSGKDFQKVESDYKSAQSRVRSHESQLRQLGIDPEQIREGDFYDRIPIRSPINGSITMVDVKTGQFVQPEKSLFEIVNVDHIHADLMVFEKDVHLVEKGQEIRFTVESNPGNELSAVIYAVGQKFEKNPKAIHVHAEITNKKGKLIPGMYIRGEILTEKAEQKVLPDDAVIREGDQHLVFIAEEKDSGGQKEWHFSPVAVIPKLSSRGWTEIQFLDSIPAEAQFALNNAYYLNAELNKGEGDHGH